MDRSPGYSASPAVSSKLNKSIIGADEDGYYRITIISLDRMEKCYAHSATSQSRSIVAACHVVDRVKK